MAINKLIINAVTGLLIIVNISFKLDGKFFMPNAIYSRNCN